MAIINKSSSGNIVKLREEEKNEIFRDEDEENEEYEDDEVEEVED